VQVDISVVLSAVPRGAGTTKQDLVCISLYPFSLIWGMDLSNQPSIDVVLTCDSELIYQVLSVTIESSQVRIEYIVLYSTLYTVEK
jgi:hypothetical protein